MDHLQERPLARQPLSPYLFIIVADFLQQLINNHHDSNGLCHPIYVHLPPTTLQYADDTLIIAKASEHAAQSLKLILHDFALATGLVINFHKTTFVALHVDAATAASIAMAIGCPVSFLPQTYLGLPLSPLKLPSSAFRPIIDRCLIFLSGWRALLLSKGGRLILLAAVINSLAIYYMSVFRLPKNVIKQLDSIRHAFF